MPASSIGRRPFYVATVVSLLLVVGGAALILAVPPTVPPSIYVEAVVDEPPLLNPLLATYTQASHDALPLVFAGLLRPEPDGSLTPDLAERWEASTDGQVYTVWLRDGLTWHDGHPLDADDVVFTVGLLQSEGHQGSAELAEPWRGIGVDAIDGRTARFTLPEPLASFPDHLTLGIVPRHALPGATATDLPRHPFNRRPIGSGPYRVVEADSERLVLRRHEDHYRPTRLDRIELRFFADRSDAISALLDGAVDGMAHLRPDEIARIATESDLAVYTLAERSKLATIALNVETPLFRDRSVRAALGSAVDRLGLVAQALRGQGEPAFGPIPVQSWAYKPPTEIGAYDPGAAARLLEGAGWRLDPDGRRERDGQPLAFTLATATTPDRLAVAELLAAQLAVVGFTVALEALPADELIEERLDTRRFEAALVGQWAVGVDPDVYSQWHSSQAPPHGNNYGGFTDPDVDRWLEVGRQVLSAQERRNAYVHFQGRWSEEQPSIVLYHPMHSFAVRKELRGVRADPSPDSSWRLRGAVNWQRVAAATPLDRVRALVRNRLPELLPTE